MKLRTHYESTAFSCYTRDNTIRDFMYNSGRNVMKLTIVLYNNKKMIGKYLVDTISKTLDTFEREDDFLLNTEFTYERMVDFLKGRQIDFGRKNRKELLGYTYTAPDVWHEIAMTHGFDTDDFYWVSIPELNDEKFVLEDHHPNLSRK